MTSTDDRSQLTQHKWEMSQFVNEGLKIKIIYTNAYHKIYHNKDVRPYARGVLGLMSHDIYFGKCVLIIRITITILYFQLFQLTLQRFHHWSHIW